VESNQMLMNFINVMFENSFSEVNEEYGVVFFKDNVGRGAKKIMLQDKMYNEILDYTNTLDANEVILIHSQPTTDISNYPSQDDIDMFIIIEKELTKFNIKIYNNAVISKVSGEWQCTSFKDVKQEGNFK